ncbi:folate-binding protein [Trueperella pecoris]|uniref:Folate-binding protein n=1 Tax=Trueperella pecoris TaxID=2733571 RepID=A0A7M1R2U5_9ACTO|nr:folate-binding protein [Trueperella pecoris]QOR48024.1 folate-binding protein [Trueperella pecoris]
MNSSLPGAVLDACGVPAHYGNPFAEQSRLVAGKAFTDVSFVEVVVVSGQDRLTWLHNLTTRDFTNLAPGESSEMLLLGPNGHIQAAAGVIDDGERTWLLMDRGQAEPVAAFLESMVFRMRVEIERPDYDVVGVVIPRSEQKTIGGDADGGEAGEGTESSVAAAPAGDPPADFLPAEVAALAELVWEDPWPRTLPGGAHYGVADSEHPARASRRVLVLVKPGVPVVEAFVAAGYSPAGLQAWEAQRVADWRPRPNNEIVARALPHELDWLRTAVHLEKGCYRGQETVAKLVNLGKPPRRLTYLYLEGPEGDLPAAGSEVKLGEKTVGVLTSVARDYEEGPVALALIKRNTALDAQLSVGGFIAAQVEIVSREGKSSASPAQRPGAGMRGVGHRTLGA